jgi:hypothetical protein
MNVTHSFAIAATFAAVAVGAASPASAAPVMSGHYIGTVTAPGGQTSTNDFYFTPCGDGCADESGDRAMLVNGLWTMDKTDNAVCPDGTRVDSAISAHYAWDPNTLAGTIQDTDQMAACGNPAGFQWTNNLQFRQA